VSNTNLVGKVVSGRYKRAGREASEMAIEVSAHVVIPDTRGNRVPYYFGTRLDSAAAGNVMLVRSNCFKPDSVKVAPATSFKPIEGLAEGEWFVTPPSEANASFAYVERVKDPSDQQWAASLGGKPLANYVVKAA